MIGSKLQKEIGSRCDFSYFSIYMGSDGYKGDDAN